MSFKNVDRHWRLAFFVVVLPMVAAIVYYAFFAVDRYVSSAQIVVGDQGGNASQQVPGLALLMNNLTPVSRQETLYVSRYITSYGMLAILEKQLNWHNHYATQRKDPLYWVSRKIQRENLLDYYRRLVTVTYDDATGLLHVSVQGLAPAFTQQTLEVILDASERFVNDISKHIAREQVRFAQEELEKARLNYEQKRYDLIQFQNEHKLLDAQASAQSLATIIAALESSLATERANLKGLLSSLRADAPQVRQQRVKIDSLERQLSAERNLLASPAQGTGEHLNSLAAKFRKLMVDAQIAEDAYKLSVSALENSRIEANKNVHSLLTVVAPNLPEGALYPERIYNLCTLFVVLLFVYGLTRFIIASIEDHRD